MTDDFRSGFVTLIGRPNTGKSTLLNAILGQKIAIVADRSQTTRNRLLGIKTLENAQIIFTDTPGIHTPRHALGAAMVKAAHEALKDIDVVVFVTDAVKPFQMDRDILDLLKASERPVLLVLNKIDRMKPEMIAQAMQGYDELFRFSAAFSVSALKGRRINALVETIAGMLPPGPKYYGDDMVTDQYERFMAGEIIREKIIKCTSEEVPHAVAVEVTEWKQKKDGLISISAQIYVEREGQKRIIIGKNGEILKKIGTRARIDIEKIISAKVFLELWVKVKKNWRDDHKMLQQLGYR